MSDRFLVAGNIFFSFGAIQYRYFFSIKNNDTQNFDGEVKISWYSSEGEVWSETFTPSQPISPGTAKSIYDDIPLGPVSIHGLAGVSSYKFWAKENGQLVKDGEGTITDKLETL